MKLSSLHCKRVGDWRPAPLRLHSFPNRFPFRVREYISKWDNLRNGINSCKQVAQIMSTIPSTASAKIRLKPWPGPKALSSRHQGPAWLGLFGLGSARPTASSRAVHITSNERRLYVCWMLQIEKVLMSNRLWGQMSRCLLE
jgi:hypothetical protein